MIHDDDFPVSALSIANFRREQDEVPAGSWTVVVSFLSCCTRSGMSAIYDTFPKVVSTTAVCKEDHL